MLAPAYAFTQLQQAMCGIYKVRCEEFLMQEKHVANFYNDKNAWVLNL